MNIDTYDRLIKAIYELRTATNSRSANRIALWSGLVTRLAAEVSESALDMIVIGMCKLPDHVAECDPCTGWKCTKTSPCELKR
jgi:hypothetical protein